MRNNKIYVVAMLLFMCSCSIKHSGYVMYKVAYGSGIPNDTAMLYYKGNTSLFTSNSGFNYQFSFQIVDTINSITKARMDMNYAQPMEVFIKRNKMIASNSIMGITKYTTEPTNGMVWTILDTAENVYGMLCQKANTHFRGRDYSVWFTTEIPVGYGPWKFNGLPGLVIKVEEQTGHMGIDLISFTPEYNNDIPRIDFDSLMTVTEYLKWFKKEMPRVILPDHAVYDNPDLEVSVDISTFTELLE